MDSIDQIAGLMDAGHLMDHGPEGDDREAVDGRSNRTTTQVRTCAASGCAHWADNNCSLNTIEVNKQGGCGNYEAAQEDDDPECDVIMGISDMMPDMIDLPAPPDNLAGRFNPGHRS